MTGDRVREAEHWLGWPSAPEPPRRYRRPMARANEALVGYVLDADRTACRRLADALARIVADRKFDGSPVGFRLAVLHRAGMAHNWTFGDPELVTARNLFTEALRWAPSDGPWRARLEYALGNTVLNLFGGSRDAGLLAVAEGHARRAVTQQHDDTRLAALCRAGLAIVLRAHIKVSGDVTLFDDAIGHAEWAVTAAGSSPLGHRFKYALAELLGDRNERYGNLDDLDRAIGLLAEAGQVPDHMFSPRGDMPADGVRGTLLRRRYLRTHDRADLDEAIRLMRRMARDRDDGEFTSQGNLGNALLTRYEHHGDREDLVEAVKLQLMAVEHGSGGGSAMPIRHNNLGNALAVAWRATGDPDLVEAAIAHYRTALELTSDGAPERASREYNLAITLHATGDPTRVAEAVDAYRAAVRHGLDSALEWALGAARSWGRWAAAREEWDEACEAYSAALGAVERLFGTQLLRRDKEAWLTESQGLPASAAYAFTRAGRVTDAIVALETGRGLLMSEVLERDRADLDRLAHVGRSELVERYRAAAADLDGAMHGRTTPESLRARRRALDLAVGEIREVEGLEGFLLRPDMDDIRKAVPPGAAVIYLAAAEAGGVALVVDGEGRVGAAELPLLTATAVGHRLRVLHEARDGAWKGALDAVTRWLWEAVAEPVLAAAGAVSHLVLVPSGVLAMFPLHAAWTTGSGGARRYLLDERVVSYTPNARALDVTRRAAARVAAERLVVVADPTPTTLPPVGYAQAEAAWARHWYPHSELLTGADANHDAVLAALGSASVHHFICHGRARTQDPLNSALVLAGDRELNLRDILALGRPWSGSARLAVLSACDTDRPGTTLPDEVVSLPSGLIQAGFAGVVATQWAVRGEAASLLTARFHQLWRGAGQPPAEALREAQRWLRDTENAEKIHDLTVADDGPLLVPLVRHLRLRDPADRPYTHPTYWAAFGFHGS